MLVRQRFLNLIFNECKKLYPNEIEKACSSASEHEKSVYDRSKSKDIYSNLAANLIKMLRDQHQKKLAVNPYKQVNTTKAAVSHEAMLADPRASKISYSINKKKSLTIKDLNGKLKQNLYSFHAILCFYF